MSPPVIDFHPFLLQMIQKPGCSALDPVLRQSVLSNQIKRFPEVLVQSPFLPLLYADWRDKTSEISSGAMGFAAVRS
jgi:hypothetical protein